LLHLWIRKHKKKKKKLVGAQIFLNKLKKNPELFKRYYHYDPETERQIFQWTTSQSPLPKTARTSCSKVYTLVTVFATYKYSAPRITCSDTNGKPVLLQRFSGVFQRKVSRKKNGAVTCFSRKALSHSSV